jgi:hypothetical protein
MLHKQKVTGLWRITVMQKMHDLLGRVGPDGLVTFVAMAEVRSFNDVYQG